MSVSSIHPVQQQRAGTAHFNPWSVSGNRIWVNAAETQDHRPDGMQPMSREDLMFQAAPVQTETRAQIGAPIKEMTVMDLGGMRTEDAA